MIYKTIDELKQIKETALFDDASFASEILYAIAKKNPDDFLKKHENNLIDYVSIYDKYKNKNKEFLNKKLSDLLKLPAINIIIILHLIKRINTGRTIIKWPLKKQIKKISTEASSLEADKIFMAGIINSIITRRDYPLPSEYCEATRYLPRELTPHPGYYDYDYTPYLREIVNNFSPLSPIREVVFLKPAQIGATTGILEAVIQYYIGACPRTQLYVSADKELVEKGMEVKVDRMLDTTGLRDLIAPQTATKTRKTGDRKTEKDFPGGFLHAIGALNPGKLRSMNYMIALLDEFDAFPETLKNEGSPEELIKNRIIVPYEDTCKILYLSTPLILQTSKTIKLYLQGDQRNYYVPCKNCEEMIVLHWHLRESQTKTGDKAGIIFETTESGRIIKDSVFYKCQNCGKLMVNDDKTIILGEGEWRPTAEAIKDRLRSYWINALYSPVGMFSWYGMVEAWLDCWDVKRNKVKDIEKYRSFRNTKEGKGFEEMGEAPKYERVIQHRRPYQSNEIPNELCIKDNGYPILLLICSVDVQKTCLYVDVKGYTYGGRSYTIDWRVIEGDTLKKNDDCYVKLAKIIEEETWKSSDGKLYRIRTTFVDAAYGESTPAVYNFCSQYSFGVYPVFGEQWIQGERKGVTFTEASKRTIEKAGCVVYKINTTITKDRIAASFRSDWNQGEDQPEWKPNFPDDFRDDYFHQFEAEYKAKKISPITNKVLGFFWKLIEGRDNHAFDTAGYNIAALECVAEFACIERLGLDSLNWTEFWNYAAAGTYFKEIKEEKKK